MPKNVVIYSRSTCAPCRALKHFLSKKGIQFTNKDITQDEEAQAEAFAYSGAMVVPVTVITKQDDSREVITGFNVSQLSTAIA